MVKIKLITQSPVPSHQSPVPSHQSPVPSHQSPVPSPQSPITSYLWQDCNEVILHST
ncbi:MAG: hypothetical protein ACKPBC_13215 [Sphaerospermopsis kisseleviana]